jgi:hypothetical protein
MYVHMLYTLVLPFAAVFYSFFVFDTLGSSHGWLPAIWLTVALGMSPFILTALISLYKKCVKEYDAALRKRQVRSVGSLLVNDDDDDRGRDDDGDDDGDEKHIPVDIDSHTNDRPGNPPGHPPDNMVVDMVTVDSKLLPINITASPTADSKAKSSVAETESNAKEKEGVVRCASQVVSFDIGRDENC